MISLILLIFCLIVFGILIVLFIANHQRNKGKFNKPHWTLLLSLFFQVLLFVMFFTTQLEKITEALADVLWWGTVMCGCIFGVMNFKKNIYLSTITVMISFALAGLMLLMLGITSM
ncbi:hypothetical protein [Bacillus sp. OAE603]|uniref:hypothetical protein n=1 Tax=Gottfriedia sp. OAE603 TaxID=2663872 RepID=UPI00178A7D03